MLCGWCNLKSSHVRDWGGAVGRVRRTGRWAEVPRELRAEN